MSEQSWPGGYTRVERSGRTTFVIERVIQGRRWHISTRTHSLGAAMRQLERFETNPSQYRPGGGTGAPIVFDEKLRSAFLAWSAATQRNSPRWVGQQRLYLEWWRTHFDGDDLREITLPEILKALEGAKARCHRIAVLKRLYSWLVSERHSLRPEHNPTAALRIPQARPEQWTRLKAITRKQFEKVRAGLSGHWRDAADILAGTGAHVAELVRFAKVGRVVTTKGRGAILEFPQTKGGEVLRVEVSASVANAARRLLKRGGLDRDKFDDAVRTAADLAGVDFRAGQMRHTVATHAINAGADPAAVAAFLGHKSPRTSLRFYATHATPSKVPTLR